jgi:hypothetical protein
MTKWLVEEWLDCHCATMTPQQETASFQFAEISTNGGPRHLQSLRQSRHGNFFSTQQLLQN